MWYRRLLNAIHKTVLCHASFPFAVSYIQSLYLYMRAVVWAWWAVTYPSLVWRVATTFVESGWGSPLYPLLPTRDNAQCLTPAKSLNSFISNNGRLSLDLLHNSSGICMWSHQWWMQLLSPWLCWLTTSNPQARQVGKVFYVMKCQKREGNLSWSLRIFNTQILVNVGNPNFTSHPFLPYRGQNADHESSHPTYTLSMAPPFPPLRLCHWAPCT